MSVQTLAMVKSDALKRGHLSAIIREIDRHGFMVVAEKMRWLNAADCEFLYAAHMNKPYYANLYDSVKRGAYLMVLELHRPYNVGNDKLLDTVQCWRLMMTGEFDGIQIKGPSMRNRYGGRDRSNAADNALHGSDAVERARAEIAYFFPELNKV